MRKPLLLASLAGLAIWLKRRRANAPDAAPDRSDTTAGSDGGSGMGGGQGDRGARAGQYAAVW